MKLLITLSAYICVLLISASTCAADNAMTAGDLQQICQKEARNALDALHAPGQ